MPQAFQIEDRYAAIFKLERPCFGDQEAVEADAALEQPEERGAVHQRNAGVAQ